MARQAQQGNTSGGAEPGAGRKTGRTRGKAIVLFSDGTGNSSAQLFKTNVWRMYEAVDLGPPARNKRHQVSYYDDGVGTSAFKPLAMLGGAFGWGLKRNVLELYRFACRNYRDGDEIYGFGFSRGAFTMRLVIALIASQGLVDSTNEAELERKSKAAYRAFRTAFLPRKLQWPTKLFRSARQGIARLRGQDGYDPADNRRPVIRFVGVWDTVAAYGGPITEITRAIDNWIFPLSMPDYELSERVGEARHALALDDERDAFHPLLWDEVHERGLIAGGKVRPDRLQQVWFTGMHADVGGGYPDESLSYVSLLWMMEEAEKAGLRTLKVVKDRFVALASSYGPLHDSRAGLGAYYRYQPRKISAWTDPVDPSTLSLRDPDIVDGRGCPKGLLCSVQVHESVINRIANGTDRYAPLTLPPAFDVVPPQKEGENVPQPDSEEAERPAARATPQPLVSAAVRARLADPAVEKGRAMALERVWNRVWYRRMTYFATVLFTLLLLTMPFWIERAPSVGLLSDGRTWIGGIIRLLTMVLPGFADSWVQIYADNPAYFLILVGAILLLLFAGSRIERGLRDKARRVWQAATAQGPPPAPPSRPSRVERFRNSRLYQGAVQRFKWKFLPDWVFAPLIVVFLLWLGLAAYTQAALPFAESRLCESAGSDVAQVNGSPREFRTAEPCSESFGAVTEDRRYLVRFNVVDPWYDSSIPTSPEGLAAGELPWGLGYLAAPFRRVIDASFLQPMIEIRRPGQSRRWFDRIQIHPLSVRRVGDSPTLYEAEFTAPRSGELFMFVNDAMIPGPGIGKFDHRYFYRSSGFGPVDQRGNRGSACVTVAWADPPAGQAPPAPATPAPAGPICSKGRPLVVASR
jgi:uncharacterized protein (DUF2235 family)